MQFEYTRHVGARSPVTGASTFRIDALRESRATGTAGADLSHLIDRSYDYHSPRELRWHLAERLGLAPAAVAVSESA